MDYKKVRIEKFLVCLQLSVSNESVAVLRKVGFSLSGNFSCEVTVEAPSFSTATVHQQMLVVGKSSTLSLALELDLNFVLQNPTQHFPLFRRQMFTKLDITSTLRMES